MAAALQLVASGVQDAEDPIRRKHRGAYFTPPSIAQYLTEFAVGSHTDALVLDPTCGDGVFLRAAASKLQPALTSKSLTRQLFGIDIDETSVAATRRVLAEEGATASLVCGDFCAMAPPDDLFATLPLFDAVVGNPPYVRYQQHMGRARKVSAAAALRQGVPLSGLASSWAAILVHAAAFLRPEGRLAMVLPAELMTVGYAEPIRRWLKHRFTQVNLILFERLQFGEALENVVLLLAQGSDGCNAFSLNYVRTAGDLPGIGPYDHIAVAPSSEGKWTDLLLTSRQRQLFGRVKESGFQPLSAYGAAELGTVTGANDFFALPESMRRTYGLEEGRHVCRISPPGTRHLRGLSFTESDWTALRDEGHPVWLLDPTVDRVAGGFKRYLESGERRGVNKAYKCTIRDPWWRPPVVTAPHLFFTYMSHQYPRLVANRAGVTFLNSMHGVRLKGQDVKLAQDALPLLSLNTLTLLGAEIHGRSYGGGVLKMEPREASTLPVPSHRVLAKAWELLRPEKRRLDADLRNGRWTAVVARVDEIVLRDVLKLESGEIDTLTGAAQELRSRRLARSGRHASD